MQENMYTKRQHVLIFQSVVDPGKAATTNEMSNLINFTLSSLTELLCPAPCLCRLSESLESADLRGNELDTGLTTAPACQSQGATGRWGRPPAPAQKS